MIIEIANRDIGDFFFMVRWFTLNKGNTFANIYQQMKKEYPDIAKSYGDNE